MPTNPSETFAPFDVVVVPFPYSDRLSEKRRPAVIISTTDLTRDCSVLWLLMITSAENRPWHNDVTVSNLKLAGLPAPSLIRTAKIATADPQRIEHRIGRLAPKDAQAVAKRVAALVAKTNP